MRHPDITILTAPPPNPVSQCTVQVVGGPAGMATYYYWIVAHFPIGSVVGGPFLITGAPKPTNPTNYVIVSWTPVPPATSYDVLRTSTDQLPPDGSNFALALGLTSPLFRDQGQALQPYSVGGLPHMAPVDGWAHMNNRDYAEPVLELWPTVHLTKIIFPDGSEQITASGGGGGGEPAGGNGQIQFNNNGQFGANANFVWNNINSRLGVGTANPQYTLDVAGNINASIAIAAPSIVGYTSLTTFSNLTWVTSGPRWNILTTNPETGGNTGSDLNITRFNDAGVFIDTPVNVVRQTGLVQIHDGLEVFGKVGIGTTTPQYELDVNGNANVSGYVIANNVDVLNGGQLTFAQGGNVTSANNLGFVISGGLNISALSSYIQTTTDFTLNSTTGEIDILQGGNFFIMRGGNIFANVSGAINLQGDNSLVMTSTSAGIFMFAGTDVATRSEFIFTLTSGLLKVSNICQIGSSDIQFLDAAVSTVALQILPGTRIESSIEHRFLAAIIAPSLPAANPGAGTKQFWYDPADGNTVKFAA